jgi:prepilin-type N-terminal cleavage/methylation domain-containing protein
MTDRRGHRGFSLVEVVILLLVIAVASTAVYTYLGATRKSLETVNSSRPIAHARIMADLSTLAAIRTQLGVYQATHGQWPASGEELAAALRPAPQFQCAVNDYTYDPQSGAVGLVIIDAEHC